MAKKACVFCSQGLGDGIIFLSLSQNLQKGGYDVDTYHPFLEELGGFCDLKIKKPNLDLLEESCLDSTFSSYDLIIINTDSSKINLALQKWTEKNALKKSIKVYFLHATTCKGKKLPGNYYLDREKTIVENLKNFSLRALNIKEASKDSPFFLKENIEYRKYPNRIAIHPSCKNKQRAWPLEKFIFLAKKIKKKGYDPVFTVSKTEEKDYEDIRKYGLYLLSFSSLSSFAKFIAQSGFFLGNDSGIGHLASSLKIPTFTIFSSPRKQKFWKPDFFYSSGIMPLNLIPNIKNMRLREKYWKKFISPTCVYFKFLSFINHVQKMEQLYESKID